MRDHYRPAQASQRAVSNDDVVYYDALATRAGKIDSEPGLHGLWREIKAVSPSSKRNGTTTRCAGNEQQMPSWSTSRVWKQGTD